MRKSLIVYFVLLALAIIAMYLSAPSFTRYLLMIEILIFYISTLMFILSASFENVYLLGIGLILYIFCLWRFVRDE